MLTSMVLTSELLLLILDQKWKVYHYNIDYYVFKSFLTGQKVLNSLIQNGIKCSYILINAVTYIMKEVVLYYFMYILM